MSAQTAYRVVFPVGVNGLVTVALCAVDVLAQPTKTGLSDGPVRPVPSLKVIGVPV